MKLQFTGDKVLYEIRLPYRRLESRSFPFVMVNTSLVRVAVDDDTLDYWERSVPGAFSREGYTMFGYDPYQNRVSAVSTGEAYELVPTRYTRFACKKRTAAPVIKPHGKYFGKANLGGTGLYGSYELSVTMEFKDIDGGRRIDYHFTLAGSEYSLLVKPTLLMQTSSLIQVELLELDVSGIQSFFPGLSKDFFYKNLGYDSEKDIVTLVLDSSKHITLVNEASSIPTTPPSPTPTAPPSLPPTSRKPLGHYTRGSPPTSVQLKFLPDGRLVFETPANRAQAGEIKYSPYHATVWVSSSLVRVLVNDAEARLWANTAPAGDHFKAESFTLLGYDPENDIITMIGRDGAYEFSADHNQNSTITKPSGVYKGQNGALSVSMRFSQSGGSSLVYYDIQLGQRYAPGSRQITFTRGSPFVMLSSSIIDVDLSTSGLSDIHFSLPGLSTDYYYTTLGYDSATNVVTF
ncbi:hypothetical protein FOZ63_009433, partial [Perkinsus olseni]